MKEGRLVLHLRVGERVRIGSLTEILATLDHQGCLDALPFMPEMIPYCGQEFTVFKRIDKINDTVDRTGLRRMENAVILEGVRCDGKAHRGCQALCQLIWKEAWVRRVGEKRSKKPDSLQTDPAPASALGTQVDRPLCTEARLVEATWRAGSSTDERFWCQATEIKNASSYLAWWDPRQYVKDLRSGNVSALELISAFLFWIFSLVVHRIGGYRVLVGLYNYLQKFRGGELVLPRQGSLKKTPKLQLNLEPGELVLVKSHDEIVDTLDENNKNRGLWFDLEMVKYCGGTYRVLSRVETIIDHKTGRMLNLPNDCIILEGVTTRGDHHRFYPQNEYPFWREIWLRRVPDPLRGHAGDRKRTHAETSD
jgi:hypothetical protein